MSELEKTQERSRSETLSVLLGAAFLMATSAIGPGFLTQTISFTNELKAAFAFAILLSILIDIVVQLNIWRILAVSGMRAQDVANKVLPGLGYFLAFAVALGGLAFNVGNVGGAALGFEVLFGSEQVVGASVSAAIAITIFLWKDLGKAMDKFTQILGFLMLALVFYVVFVTKPPVMDTVREMVKPLTSMDLLKEYKWLVVLTLVGGTVGGYITFSGAHRIIDAGITGKENLSQISRGSINGIAITGVMRYLLFLAFLGVVLLGTEIDMSNPVASAFKIGAGEMGFRIAGVVLWAAAITSVVGASYTSVSFLRTLFGVVDKYYRFWIIGFIIASTSILTLIGRPVKLLIVAGSLNGLILPLSLGCVLLAAYKKEVVKDYVHPMWMTLLGWVIVVFTAWMGFNSFAGIVKLFQ
ncbi:MAG: divalent metal cation transporter [Synergistaceae bacterium]|jgi:Mn2+/Fe2+ NRAMP family transporter|uniref:NRAMP family divalent metal transporter n=1 Tax=Aminivibrio sp. TaxID=1872489 RepID=UPI00345E7DE4|nr:divalent metal cation transporter [Synergistaceae bacterium]MDD3688465.1 divalent metal cation transporter [Synergistaceae bacterium]MDD4021314.1 divalent metal cation transporter [Synergistaceae bacterium]MDD4612723.1 divalent metal cation transporter [Synergistaceae bacterium]